MEQNLQAAVQRAAFRGLLVTFVAVISDNPHAQGIFYEPNECQELSRDGKWSIAVGGSTAPHLAFMQAPVEWRIELSRRRGTLTFHTEATEVEWWAWHAHDWEASGTRLGALEKLSSYGRRPTTPLAQGVFEAAWSSSRDALRRYLQRHGMRLSLSAKAVLDTK